MPSEDLLPINTTLQNVLFYKETAFIEPFIESLSGDCLPDSASVWGRHFMTHALAKKPVLTISSGQGE